MQHGSSNAEAGQIHACARIAQKNGDDFTQAFVFTAGINLLLSKAKTARFLAKESDSGVGATDVTGYGLIGHLISLCRASRVSGKINQAAVPMISEEIGELIELGCVPQGSRDNLNSATVLVDWASTDEVRKILLTDAQTSGGLLLCVAEANFEKVMARLRKVGTASAALIGKIAPRRRRRPLIGMTE